MKYNIFVYGLMVIGAISIMGCSGKKNNFSPNEPGRADITKSSVITDSVEGENAEETRDKSKGCLEEM
jgi:hypothetical protein